MSAMTGYRVTLRENDGDRFTIVFDCMADDADHAKEQALNAYPDGRIINCTPDTWSAAVLAAGPL